MYYKYSGWPWGSVGKMEDMLTSLSVTGRWGKQMLNSADADGLIARFIVGKEPEGNGASKQENLLV